MSLFGLENGDLHSLVSSNEEDFLIRKILITHDPDGCQLDTELLLRAVKNIIHFACPISEAVCLLSWFCSDPENEATGICDAEAIGLQDSIHHL
ncbi:hypothetical protein ACH5RR_030763 [Cinchona calisaya]|uniref:Uncharacterized protein n=1 Tax=Cinchona calisaya TaxID=153742 RepID=A0ABD2YVM3_9GENT